MMSVKKNGAVQLKSLIVNKIGNRFAVCLENWQMVN